MISKKRTLRTEPEVPVAVGFGNAPGDVAAVLRGVDFARLTLYGAARSPTGQVAFEPRWRSPRALDDEEMLDGALVPAVRVARARHALPACLPAVYVRRGPCV